MIRAGSLGYVFDFFSTRYWQPTADLTGTLRADFIGGCHTTD